MKKLMFALLLVVCMSFVGLLVAFAPPTSADSLQPSLDVEVLHPGEGKTVMLGKIPVLFKTIAAKGQSGQISITESSIEPGEGAPLHKHAPETFYVISGDFEFYAGQPDGTLKTLKAKTGDLINVPAGIPHAPKNVGKAAGQLLTITGADWFQNFLEELTTPDAAESSEFGVPSIEKMAPVGKKYGIEFVESPPQS